MNKEIGKRKKKKKNCDNGPSRQLNPAERRCRRDDRANGPAAVRRSEAGEPEDDGPSTRAVGLLNRPKISESWRRRWIDEERKREEIEEKGIRRRKEENKIALNYCRMRMREKMARLWDSVGWSVGRRSRTGRRNEDLHNTQKARRSSPYSPRWWVSALSILFSPLFFFFSLLSTLSRHTRSFWDLPDSFAKGKFFGVRWSPVLLSFLFGWSCSKWPLLTCSWPTIPSVDVKSKRTQRRFKEHWYKRLTQYAGVENDQRQGSSSFFRFVSVQV